MEYDGLVDPEGFLGVMEAHYEAGNGKLLANGVMETMQDWCASERFDLCDELLKHASPNKIGTTLTIAMLEATQDPYVLGKLKERDHFMILAEEYIFQKNPDNVHLLLDRFK